jgi:hypothetical protein
MKLCCFISLGTTTQVAIKPEIITRIAELQSGHCNIFTSDGHQPIVVHGSFETVVDAVAEALKDTQPV